MPLLVAFSRRVPATVERVYDAWLDPLAIAHFMCPAPGVTVRDVAVHATVGGSFSLTMVAGEMRIPIQGTYVTLDRPHTLAFTWLSHRTTDESLLTLTFEPADGGTQMTLRHEGFPDAASRDDHDGGWNHIAERLIAWCSSAA